MNSHTDLQDCLDLMQKLVEYRHEKALHHQLLKAAERSMLYIDVLLLIYHFAKVSEGDILEIGSYVGGSTIAAAMGARDSGKQKQIISIELGGRLEHPRLPSKDIFKDLKKNLARAGMSDVVTLVNGSSFEEKTISTVREMTRPGEIGAFVFDAHSNVQRDLNNYGDRFSDRCWVVIDDYLGGTSKTGLIRTQVDELVALGRLVSLGFYGWGTWIGQWRRSSF